MDPKGFFSNHIKPILFSWRRVGVTIFVVAGLVGIFLLAGFGYIKSYEGNVLPGISIGNISIGGMDKEELGNFIRQMNTKLLDQGIRVSFESDGQKKEFTINPVTVGDQTAEELITIDVDKEVMYLLQYGRGGGWFDTLINTISIRARNPRLTLQTVDIQKNYILDQIHKSLEGYIIEPVDSNIHIKTLTPLTYEVTSSTPGNTFDFEYVLSTIKRSWSELDSPHVFVTSHTKNPMIIESDVQGIYNRLESVFAPGKLDILFTDPYTTRVYTWFVSPEEMALWIEVQRASDGSLVFGLNYEHTTAFLKKDISDVVNVEAKDAKFSIASNGKVAEFQGSRPGVTVDLEKTYADINQAFIGRTLHDEGIVKAITLTTKHVEPNIKTGEVNELGISEILGFGHSKFKGSPGNRIKNISHAAYNKLHGLLIKPGQEFSLIQALQPFTIEDGYLPELVIKGDRIIPELGGGLCQVGTTMFRAAMNSGLPITERRNHSLVVSYYNDLSNGNPGTDATIYEPHPDLRFLNDTNHYILITSEMNTKTSDLYFYFWGTNDGRKGYYSAPLVSKWIPAGNPRIIETTELPVGKKECQEVHVGAQTSFTYTRELSSGEKIEKIFESYYRPLPQICLVGVEKVVETVCPEGQECSVTDIPSDTPIDEQGFDPNIDLWGSNPPAEVGTSTVN